MKYILIITLLLTIASSILTGCGSEHQNNLPTVEPIASVETNGTSDTGGGSAQGSTIEEVHEAIQSAKDLLIDDSFRDQLLNTLISYTQNKAAFSLLVPRFPADFDEDAYNKERQEETNRLYEMRNNGTITEAQFHEMYLDFLDRTYEYHLKSIPELLTDIKINILDDSPCTTNGDNHVDASVSSHDENAEVCFSAYSLKRINASDLEKQLIGLWLHEITHIHGFKEKDAHEVHEAVINNYELITSSDINNLFFHRISSSHSIAISVSSNIINSIETYNSSLESNTITSEEASNKLANILFEKGKLVAQLISLKEFYQDFNRFFVTGEELRDCSIPVYEKHFEAVNTVVNIFSAEDLISNFENYKALIDDVLEKIKNDKALFQATSNSRLQNSVEKTCSDIENALN